MKRVMQKFIVCLVLVFGILALAGTDVKAATRTGKCGDKVTWSLDTGTGVLTIKGEGPMKNYPAWPASGFSPFNVMNDNYINISQVVIEDGVTSIGDYVFHGCTLKSITIPNSVTSIGTGSFNTSSLTSVTIPNGVTSIGDSAFKECTALQSITIPNSVTSIGDSAFNECSALESITIPDSVISVGEDAFRYTAFYKNNDNWENGILYSGNVLLATTSDIPSGGFAIKAGTKVIANKAFEGKGSGFTEIVIPDSVITIGDYAFESCYLYLNKVTLGKGVTSIGKGAFSGCSGLNEITIDRNVTSIGEDAFKGCASRSANKTIEISGYKGTVAESYAAANNHKFVALDATEPDKQEADKTTADKTTTTTTTTTKKEVIKGKAPKVSIKAKAKKITIKYTASSKAVGFQVRYKKGSGKWVVKNYNSKKSVTKTIKGLKKGKYSVQVRSFTSGKKTYSKWSKTKKVTVK